MAKALPLQIHPDKDLAARLHQRDPEKYGDANHKPEIGVALTTFELFVGFKPLNEIQKLLQLQPLHQFIPSSQTHFNNETLKRVCSAMLTASEATVRNVTNELHKLPEDVYGKHSHIPALLPRLQGDYTDADNGILVALICMNYLVLQPGEAVYVPADGIHAWLSGDIVECMARSDNVINTGFCPRADRDSIDLFTSALTFDPHSAEQSRLEMSIYHGSASGATRVYVPPLSEFNMLVTQLNAQAKETIKAIQGPSIMFVTSGKGIMRVAGKEVDLSFGYIFFVGQGVDVEFETREEKMMVYRAYAE
jgi:mannose-6-phosphate isomerase